MERKSWTHVLKAVGYRRFDTTGELRLPSEIYAALRLYKNFCLLTIRLKSKTRVVGSILADTPSPRPDGQDGVRFLRRVR